MGTTKGGAFDIPGELARSWLDLPNPSGRSNRDVLKPWVNGLDLTRRHRDMWIIDFTGLSEQQAAEYVLPWHHVVTHVKPIRDNNARAVYREKWWLFMEPRPAMLEKIRGLERYLGTARVARHRLFVWLRSQTVPNSQVIVFATDQDYDFGILHSHIHEAWSLAQGSSLEDRPRYTPSTCLETFPFPLVGDRQREHISEAGKHLDAVRAYLLSQDSQLTMTKLYNELQCISDTRDSAARANPLWLAHDALDRAVAEAYGWEWPLVDVEILERLLDLNLGHRPFGIEELEAAAGT